MIEPILNQPKNKILAIILKNVVSAITNKNL